MKKERDPLYERVNTVAQAEALLRELRETLTTSQEALVECAAGHPYHGAPGTPSYESWKRRRLANITHAEKHIARLELAMPTIAENDERERAERRARNRANAERKREVKRRKNDEKLALEAAQSEAKGRKERAAEAMLREEAEAKLEALEQCTSSDSAERYRRLLKGKIETTLRDISTYTRVVKKRYSDEAFERLESAKRRYTLLSMQMGVANKRRKEFRSAA